MSSPPSCPRRAARGAPRQPAPRANRPRQAARPISAHRTSQVIPNTNRSACSLFRKGADFTSVIAFQFASTNLVVELGIVLSVLMLRMMNTPLSAGSGGAPRQPPAKQEP